MTSLKVGGGQYKQRIKQAKQSLDHISGGERNNLLLGILRANKGKLMKEIVTDDKNDKLDKLLEFIRREHAASDCYHKRRWVSLLTPMYTRDELRGKGFVLSTGAFATAKKHAAQLSPGAAVPERRGSPKKLSANFENEVLEFVKKNSQPAASRSVIVKKNKVPVRYLNDGFENLHRLFVEQTGNKVGYTSFRDAIPNQYQQAKRATDMCGICVHGKKSQVRLQNLRAEVHSNCENCSRDAKCLFEKNSARLPDILALSERVKLFDEHMKLRCTQREAFKRCKAELSEGDVLLVIDFKANVRLNIESPQVSKSYYGQPQRTLFGVSMGYICPQSKIFRRFYYDIFSECLAHNAYFVKEALIKIFNDDLFKTINAKRVHVWMDNAGHFKNRELHHYFAKFITKFQFTEIRANYFAEYHGKSWCDSRFSLITRIMETATAQPGVAIRSTQAYIELLASELQRIADKNETKINSRQLILSLPEELSPLKKVIDNYVNIKCFQSFIFIQGSKDLEISRCFTTNGPVIEAIPYVVAEELRDCALSMKQGSPDMSLTEKDIDSFFTQLSRRSKYVQTRLNLTEHRPITRASLTKALPRVSRSVDQQSQSSVNSDLDSPIPPPLLTPTDRRTRGTNGISKRKRAQNDYEEAYSEDNELHRPTKRHKSTRNSKRKRDPHSDDEYTESTKKQTKKQKISHSTPLQLNSTPTIYMDVLQPAVNSSVTNQVVCSPSHAMDVDGMEVDEVGGTGDERNEGVNDCDCSPMELETWGSALVHENRVLVRELSPIV